MRNLTCFLSPYADGACGAAARLGVFVLLLTCLGAIPQVSMAQPTLIFSFGSEQYVTDPAAADCISSAGMSALVFDVLVQASATGSRLGDNQVYLNYNTAGFGSSVVAGGTITVAKGTLLQKLAFGGATPAYDTPVLNDNTASRVSIFTEYLFPGNPGEAAEVPTTATQMLVVCMRIADETETAGLSFDALMDDQQFQSDNDPANRYAVVRGEGSDVLLPVELIGFEAVADGEEVLLTWETASETNNAGFEVQVRRATAEASEGGEAAWGEAAWQELGFVEGHGTTSEPKGYRYRTGELEPGGHVFRLRQMDFDGAFEYSPEVEVAVEMAERYVLEPAYPNPFNAGATLRFGVREAQPVRVEMYDMLGRRVKTLFDREVPGSQMQEVRIDGSDLASGVYFVRVAGEGFQEFQQVAFVK